MAASIVDLVPEFRDRVAELLDRTLAEGCEMRPYFSMRSPFEQAKLWRQSRSSEEIKAKVAEFKSANAPFLAHCIESVGPQHGDPVTNAPPGLSWHQWGEAIDCFWLTNGGGKDRAEWSVTRLIDGLNGYQRYAAQAGLLGLTPGGYWKRMKDWPHVQLRPAASPLQIMPLREIDARMKQMFGH